MLYYPKIPDSTGCPGGKCIVFEKYDGTNLHWTWDRDFGWHAFGTRRDEFNLTLDGVCQFDVAHPGLENCAEIFESSLANGLDHIFRTHSLYTNFQEIRVFTEWFGPGSFAGEHIAGEKKELVLFDVLPEPFGLVGPQEFVHDFKDLRSARVLFQGKFSGQLVEDIRKGRYGTGEGVIIKGGRGGQDLWMAKVKTDAYLARLKTSLGDRWQEFWE